jgi:ABC-type polysaccharide/polyol phosphate export permease
VRKTLGIGLMLGWQDIRASYRRSVFGQLWITVGMAVTIASIGIVFGTIFSTPMQVFLPYLASGMIMWAMIAGILNDGTLTFIAAEGMVKQLPLPKIVYIIRVVWRNLIIAGHNIVIFPLVVLIVGGETSWAILFWPLGVLLTVTALSGLALFFAIVATRYRDLPPIVNAALTVAFYITPVIWIKESLGNNELVNTLVSLNPLYHLLQVARLPLIGQMPSVDNWIWAAASGAVFWLVAALMFRRFEKRIAYWV